MTDPAALLPPEAVRVRLSSGRELVHVPTIGSTQDLARDIALSGDRKVVGVMADEQTAGRGRRGARWHAPAGQCLLVTYILRGPDCAPEAAWRLAFAAGVAAAESVERFGVARADLKWPNDVLVGGRKLSGMLIEMAPGAPEPVALLGIGINVNVRAFPDDLRRAATSLLLETGREAAVAEVEGALRERLDALRAETAARGFPWLLDRWRQRDVTAGHRFLATIGERDVEGTAEGVGPGGELLLRLDDGSVLATLAATSVPAR